MQTLGTILEFLKSITLLTLGQLASIFGVMFVFGLLLYFLARSTRRVYTKSAGSTFDIILTGWIGVPVHEIGHAIFCLLFRHKIKRIKLFDPNPTDGTIGYVAHSYNPKSIYQRIGNFFIGVGPIIFGSIVLYTIMYYLVPNMSGVLAELEKHSAKIHSAGLNNWQLAIQSAGDSIRIILSALTNSLNFNDWRFWLFVYISMSVASHMELSPPDIKSALSGFVFLLLFVFLWNMVVMLAEAAGLHQMVGSWWRWFTLQTYMVSISKLTVVATALFIYASIISALIFLISWFLLSIYSLIRYRKGINPFWG